MAEICIKLDKFFNVIFVVVVVVAVAAAAAAAVNTDKCFLRYKD
jgi:hypothetical protein